MRRFFLCVVLVMFGIRPGGAQAVPALQLSHDSTVHIIASDIGSSGRGFFVTDTLVLTCLHVVVVTEMSTNQVVEGHFSKAIEVVTPSGESIPASLISIPTPDSSAPLDHDFAFLRLSRKPNSPVAKVALASPDEAPRLGADVYFSGYPLNTPGMVSHKGMISGSNPELALLFVEGPINKGNSGGALLNSRGHVVGLVSLREGGITAGLANLRNQIQQSGQNGSVRIMGVDPLQSTRMLIDTVDQYISVGIGYARDIQFARAYFSTHRDLAK